MKDKDLLEKRERIYPINFYADLDQFRGKLNDILRFIEELPKKLVEEHGVSKDYYTFELDWYKDYYEDSSYDLHIYGYRKETVEEATKRIEDIKKRAEASKKAIITKKQAQEKREKTLLETLKKKYESGKT